MEYVLVINFWASFCPCDSDGNHPAIVEERLWKEWEELKARPVETFEYYPGEFEEKNLYDQDLGYDDEDVMAEHISMQDFDV